MRSQRALGGGGGPLSPFLQLPGLWVGPGRGCPAGGQSSATTSPDFEDGLPGHMSPHRSLLPLISRDGMAALQI